MSDPITWLLAGPPWAQYRARLDLLRESEADVAEARRAMLDNLQVRELVAELADWPGAPLTSHKSAGHLLHKLAFIADLGLRVTDPGMEAVVARVLEHRAHEGPFQVLMNIPTRYGGTGREQGAWALCDAPLILYSLAKLGLGGDPGVLAAVDHLAGLVRDNGWPCAVSPELGGFRGPGRKGDPCPYANLVMLKVLAQFAEWRQSQPARVGVETLLTLWERSRERHPYLFYMGTDFRKLKAPLVWYDIVHLLDVLTQFPWLVGDARLSEMLACATAKADELGRYTPEAVWMAWSDWDFGQKRAPSRWLTLILQRAVKRVEE